jgi:ribose 5-phosphate isomerase B
MQILLASDHAGFELKNTLVSFLKEQGHAAEDCGASIYIEEDDYPDFILPLAQKVAQNKGIFGIVIGGSGQGEAIAANRVKGVRAAVYYGGNKEILTLSREHNDANVLSLGARFISADEAKEAVTLWLGTPFSNDERHVRRIQKLDD